MEGVVRMNALITGASSGIGLHYAREIAKTGSNLILVSNDKVGLERACNEIAGEFDLSKREFCKEEAERGWIAGVYKDLSARESAGELFDLCRQKSIDVDILINNAGIFFFNDTVDNSIERVSTMVMLHVYSVTLLCRLFGAEMAKRKKGYILNMSSLAAHTPFPGISLYSATKSYIRNMSIAMRLELKEHNVKLLTVSPGAVATGLYGLPESLQRLGVRLGIIYKPEKLARKAIKKLFSNKKEYVPGSINRLFKPIYRLIPQWLKLWIRKKTAKLRR